MADFVTVINKALKNIGLDSGRISEASGGGELYGDAGVLDSLDFVRFISELTQLLDGFQIDLFELVERLDDGLPDIFQTIESLSDHLKNTMLEEVV